MDWKGARGSGRPVNPPAVKSAFFEKGYPPGEKVRASLDLYMQWKYVFFFFLLSTLLLNNSSCHTGGHHTYLQLGQGVRGRVVKLVGDFTMDPPTGERRPISVPVHVFKGRVEPFEKPNLQHPAFLTVVKPDASGRFEVPLPPGEYTLVLEIDGRLYLNNWMEDGTWAITVVREGQWTEVCIEDVLDATF